MIEVKIQIIRQGSRDISGSFPLDGGWTPSPSHLCYLLGSPGTCTVCYFQTLPKGIGAVSWFQSYSLHQRCKCKAVSNLGLEIVTQDKEAGPRNMLSCLHKTLFSDCTLSRWHGNLPFLLSVWDIYSFRFLVSQANIPKLYAGGEISKAVQNIIPWSKYNYYISCNFPIFTFKPFLAISYRQNPQNASSNLAG